MKVSIAFSTRDFLKGVVASCVKADHIVNYFHPNKTEDVGQILNLMNYPLK